jgi:hemolysin activation/secretion protein
VSFPVFHQTWTVTCGLAGALAWLPCAHAVAQAATDPRPPTAPAFRLPPAPVSATPLGAVRQVSFEGATVVTEAELQALARPYLDRPLEPADLEELRTAITRHLVDRGFVNSGALMPDGAVRDGRLRILIVEGRLTALRVQGQGRLHEGYLAERLVGRGDEVFNVNTLQQRFQRLLADPLIARMDARIVPGAAPGEAALEVDVTRARPYRLALLANNHRPPSVGEAGGGLTGTVWNLSGRGDALDLILMGSEGSERVGAGWSVPLPRLGTVLSLRHDRGDTSVVEAPVDSIDIVSRVRSLDVGLQHPVVDTLTERVALGLAFSRRDSRSTLLGEPFSFTPGEPDGVSRLHAWRFSQEVLLRDEVQTLALRSTFSWGRNNIQPALAPGMDAPATRYAFWLGQAQLARRLTALPGAQLVLKATVQKSRDRLLPLERLAVGGVASVRGYRENQLVRDEGLMGSVELQLPLTDPADPERRVTLVPFIDGGRARNRGEAADDLGSAGLALDARLGPVGLELAAAKRLRTPPAPARRSLQDHGVHLQLRWEPL